MTDRLPSHRRGIVCIGGAVVDRTLRAEQPLRRDTSNPVTSRLGFGGVARNVGETLARLGLPVALISVVGDDPGGQALLAHARAAGLDVSAVVQRTDCQTAEYVAVLEPDGRLAFGLADMAALALITPDLLEQSHAQIAAAAMVFADCNLPAPTLVALITHCRACAVPLAIDAVSTAKVSRLPADLTGIDTLFLNRDEACALLDCDVTPIAASRMLSDRGARSVVVTHGALGCAIAHEGSSHCIPAPVAPVVDVTGAGDALVAGTLAALSRGGTFADAVVRGTELAARTIGSPDSVWPGLTPSCLDHGLSSGQEAGAKEIGIRH